MKIANTMLQPVHKSQNQRILSLMLFYAIILLSFREGMPPAAPACPLQRVEQSTGYGCQEGEECNTIYDEQCR